MVYLGLAVALFFFLSGMRLMSRALESATATRFQTLLSQLATRPLVGFLVGTLFTGIIQSSSATTVMIVALVDAGLLTLTPALPLIAGANVGTTITTQIVALEPYHLIAPLLLLGIVLLCLPATRFVGKTLLGLAMVFLGLRLMGLCLAPLLELALARKLLRACAAAPPYAFLVGLVMTALVQSSSALTGMLIAFSHTSALTLPAALGMAIGSNIGTCVTALLASLGVGPNGRSVAYAHLAFNLLGAGIALSFFPSFVRVVASTAPDLPRQIANGHTLFNLQTAIVFLPLSMAVMHWQKRNTV